MGSAQQYYCSVFNDQDFDLAVSISDRFDDRDESEDDGGHPYEAKKDVLVNLQAGYPYHKGGPAREYDWTHSDISQMAEMLRQQNEKVRENRKKRPRAIRAQNYRGETSNNYLLNWVNSVRSGKRFGQNPGLERGSKWERGFKSNHQLWETVSDILTCEFHYWMDIHKKNLALPKSKRSAAKYPHIEDLIFRVNDDFTGGLWSQFYRYWEPFINELRSAYLLQLLLITSFQ